MKLFRSCERILKGREMKLVRKKNWVQGMEGTIDEEVCVGTKNNKERLIKTHGTVNK